MTDKADIEIHFLSRPQYLCMIRGAIEALSRRLGMDEESANRVVLAVDEAITNVIRHGYENADDRPIRLKITQTTRFGREGLWFVIEDESKTDPAVIKPKPEQNTEPGGMGVRIIIEAMDEVQYALRKDGQGLQLTMFKAIEPITETTNATTTRETQP